MGVFENFSKTTQFFSLVTIILLGIAIYFGFGYFAVIAEQDQVVAQADLEAKLEKARLEGYLLSGQNVIVAINNQLFTQGFISLPIKGQDGEYVQVRFFTEQQCAAQCMTELERIMQGAG